jgi:hypothetical protein
MHCLHLQNDGLLFTRYTVRILVSSFNLSSFLLVLRHTIHIPSIYMMRNLDWFVCHHSLCKGSWALCDDMYEYACYNRCYGVVINCW